MLKDKPLLQVGRLYNKSGDKKFLSQKSFETLVGTLAFPGINFKSLNLAYRPCSVSFVGHRSTSTAEGGTGYAKTMQANTKDHNPEVMLLLMITIVNTESYKIDYSLRKIHIPEGLG